MIAWVLTIGGGVYLGLALLLYLAQDKLLFVTTRELYRTPAANGWPFDDVRLEVMGERTHGWYIPVEGAPKGVFLFSHGNAGNIADRIESASIFRNLGYDVLVYDYGGYGESTGRPSERRCYEDVRAMWRYLTETRGVEPRRIVLFGRSLGAGAACQLATEVDAGAVILESAFLSVPRRAKELYPIFPARLLVRNRFANIDKIGNIRSPLLMIHSADDTIIPIHHGRALFERAPEPKEFLEIFGDHNEGFWMSGGVYTEGIRSFLDRHISAGLQQTGGC